MPQLKFKKISTLITLLVFLLTQTTVHANPDERIIYHHSDHLSGTSIDTDENGEIMQSSSYFPFGEVLTEEHAPDYENNYKFTGKELDESGLYYYGARYYNPIIGRFVSQDTWAGDLRNPQSLNKYSYVFNNPLKYVDPTGNYVETAFDLISLSLSLYDFNQNPTLWNSAFVALDSAGVVLPVPAVFGYIKNGAKAQKIFKYFSRVSSQSKMGVAKMAKLFSRNITFKFSRRGWTAGGPNNKIANLVGHFAKHGDEVAAKSVDDYYKKANDFIDADSSYSFQDPLYNNDTIHYNPKTNEKVITNNSGDIKSYYLETRKKQQDSYSKIIKNNET